MLEYILSLLGAVLFVALAFPLVPSYASLLPPYLGTLLPILFLAVIGSVLVSMIVWMVKG